VVNEKTPLGVAAVMDAPRSGRPPVASATLHKDSTRVKTPPPKPPVTEQKQHSSDTLMEPLGKGCLLGVAVAQAACSGPQVRPPPPPEEFGAEILDRPGPDTATVVISQDVKSVRRFE
jgi:hypothetical protein